MRIKCRIRHLSLFIARSYRRKLVQGYHKKTVENRLDVLGRISLYFLYFLLGSANAPLVPQFQRGFSSVSYSPRLVRNMIHRS